MEQTKLKQFTFYDYYAKVIGSLNDENAGKLVRLVGKYMLFGEDVMLHDEDDLAYYWNYLEPTLQESRQKERSGKIAKGLNERMKHFPFYKCFYDACQRLDDSGAGQYVKAVCGCMFDSKTPKLKPPVSVHFELAQNLLDLAKKRSETGKKGGTAKRVKVEEKDANALLPFGLKGIGMDGFLKRNPQVKNDLYKNSMYLAEGVDWTNLNEVFPTSKYCDRTSLYQILSHYNEIVG